LNEPIPRQQDFQTEAHAPYFLEYPPAALGMFRLGYVFPPSIKDLDPPPWVLNANHLTIVEYEPRMDSEPIRLLWRKFRCAIRIYITLMITCLLGLMVVLSKGYDPAARLTGPVAMLLFPATLYFTANRFDIVPALLTALSLACLGRERIVLSAVFLGAATMIKVYPALLTFLVIRYLANNYRQAAVWIAGYAATLVVFLLPPLMNWGWEPTLAPFRYQLTRSMDGMTLYGHLLPAAWGENTVGGSLFRLASVLAVIFGMVLFRPENLAGLLRRACLILLVFVSLQVFYSPQWIVWFAPLWIPLVRVHPPLFWLVAGLELTTYATFPFWYDLENSHLRDILYSPLIYLRAGFLASLAATLVGYEFTRTCRGPKAPC
jgi:hypothetical protein